MQKAPEPNEMSFWNKIGSKQKMSTYNIQNAHQINTRLWIGGI